jgi:hypothetical protein
MGEDGINVMDAEIEKNYYRIKEEAQQIVDEELERLRNDPKFKELLK